MIVRQDIEAALTAYWRQVDRGSPFDHPAVVALLDKADLSARTPYRPVQHYAPGGAAMADAIERLDRELNEIKLVLDAHRAALVAAGWLGVDGSVRRG